MYSSMITGFCIRRSVLKYSTPWVKSTAPSLSLCRIISGVCTFFAKNTGELR